MPGKLHGAKSWKNARPQQWEKSVGYPHNAQRQERITKNVQVPVGRRVRRWYVGRQEEGSRKGVVGWGRARGHAVPNNCKKERGTVGGGGGNSMGNKIMQPQQGVRARGQGVVRVQKATGKGRQRKGRGNSPGNQAGWGWGMWAMGVGVGRGTGKAQG